MTVLGLTGGIGCGKSTISRALKDMGARIWDADNETHTLYRENVSVQGFILQNFPEAFDTRKWTVDRKLLGEIVLNDPDLLQLLSNEVGVHLRRSLTHFLKYHTHPQALTVLDVPLLFENGLTPYCDKIMVVHCPDDVQRKRVLARGTSEERFEKIKSLQWTNEQRFPFADYLIDTNRPREETWNEVSAIYRDLLKLPKDN